jgi:crotonobetainyl-CoA:carnitine CoA-transferase CaiB-like acyl-CoA transferase
MDNWGLNYEKLKQVNPGLVMVSLSGFGHSGPWRDFAALGPTEHALSGLTQLTSYIDGGPCGIGFAYADHVSGLYASLAVMSALQLRDSTGMGAYVDISEYEATCSLMGTSLIDYSLNHNSVKPVGNRPMWQIAAPHGCYPCKGEDRWCVIAVFSEEEWRSLCGVMGHPAWSREDRFNNAQGRSDSAEELDVLLAGWTAGYAPQDLVRMLQDAGIPAAIVSDANDMAKDPHLNARGFFIDLEHPVLGTIRSDSNPIRLSATPAHYKKAAPLLGEDNRHVFVELLGMDEKRFKSLVDDGIIG